MINFSNLMAAINLSETTYSIHTSTKRVIMLAPVIMMFLFAVFILIPETRKATEWMLYENHPVELLTFIFAFSGGIIGLALARQTKVHGETALVFGFYAAFSLALILVSMEEIAWGQKFLRFDTPAAWRAINIQRETTIHNIAHIHGHTEIFRLIFGIGGLAGVGLSFHRHFQKIGAPAILLPWFMVIALHAAVDVFNDYFPIEERFDYCIIMTSELIELLITISGFLYVVLNWKMLSRTWK
jgi:hypothetical protein